jgi:hypothetical protein
MARGLVTERIFSLVITFINKIDFTSEEIHRFLNPVTGQTYVYSYLWHTLKIIKKMFDFSFAELSNLSKPQNNVIVSSYVTKLRMVVFNISPDYQELFNRLILVVPLLIWLTKIIQFV